MGGYVQAFLALVEGRTEQEVAQVLGVVEASLHAMDTAAAAELQRVVGHVNDRRAHLAGAA